MLFNSYTFIIFFALVVGTYYLLKSWSLRKFWLLIASYIFYAVWNPPFVILLWLSTLGDWIVSRKIYITDNPIKRKFFLWVSLSINLGLLAFFKYGGFLLDNFTVFSHSLGWKYVPPELNIILPVGISFYTFQTLSYTLDIYFKKSKPWNSFLDYALYVTFFPQLVAGPIVRSDKFLPQTRDAKSFDTNKLSWGLCWLSLGLFLKVVLADSLFGPVADSVYTSAEMPNALSAWIGTVAFSGQILCDFAGYSICAIGAAQCLGFYVPKNFYFPYAASGFSDFWRRWHISLSQWLRDYLYIPMGGNRKGLSRTYLNLAMTMLIGGLWHGASWTFVFWGGLHGLYLIIERSLRGKISLPLPLAIVGTYILVCFTWVFFRAVSFSQAFAISGAMLGLSTDGMMILGQEQIYLMSAFLILMLTVQYFLRQQTLDHLFGQIKWWQRSIVLSVIWYLIITMPSQDRTFIYFQF